MGPRNEGLHRHSSRDFLGALFSKMVEFVTRRWGTAPLGKKIEDLMAETSGETLRHKVTDHPDGAEMSGPGPSAARRVAGRFDPFS
jgi:hypothetical protein